MAKEWEVIAFDEARRRAFFLDREESVVPLPELRSGQSEVLTDEICTALVAHLPARAQGYPWTLIYSTSAHGFSLKTLYRKMLTIDSPTLFIIKDVHEHVFGAIVSCALKVLALQSWIVALLDWSLTDGSMYWWIPRLVDFHLDWLIVQSIDWLIDWLIL